MGGREEGFLGLLVPPWFPSPSCATSTHAAENPSVLPPRPVPPLLTQSCLSGVLGPQVFQPTVGPRFWGLCMGSSSLPSRVLSERIWDQAGRCSSVFLTIELGPEPLTPIYPRPTLQGVPYWCGREFITQQVQNCTSLICRPGSAGVVERTGHRRTRARWRGSSAHP